MRNISRKKKLITNHKKIEKLFEKQNISRYLLTKKMINVCVVGQGIFVL